MPFETPQRWPLVSPPANRDYVGSKDARLINCYAELDPASQEYWVEKRPGLGTGIALSNTATTGLGIYNSQVGNGVLGIVYRAGAPTVYTQINSTSWNFLGTLASNSSFPARFVDFFVPTISGPSNSKTVFGDGTNAYFVSSSGTVLTKITDVNFPPSFVPGWAFLDGTLYCMDVQGNIRGSAVNDPTVWSATNTVNANSDGGTPMALAKQLVYVVAFKSSSTEFFADNANPTGTPLIALPGVKSDYGCTSGTSVAILDGTLLWVATWQNQDNQVTRMDNLQVTVISTPPVERLIKNETKTSLNAYTMKIAGHRFYMLNCGVANVTLAYDLDQQLWYRWYDANGNFWPYIGYAGNTFNGGLLQHVSNGQVYPVDADFIYPTDAGVIFPVNIYTPNFDGGVNREKTLSKMYFNGNQDSGSILQIRHSDDDYRTYSQFRTVQLSVKRPFISDEGTFHSRSYNFRHQVATPLRLKTTDLQMEIGTL